MTVLPNNWVEEDRSEIVSAIIERMIAEMSFEQMRCIVWDMLYDDLIFQTWPDLFMHAEIYAPEVLDQFDDSNSKESSH
jgi:hypothetical protein